MTELLELLGEFTQISINVLAADKIHIYLKNDEVNALFKIELSNITQEINDHLIRHILNKMQGYKSIREALEFAVGIYDIDPGTIDTTNRLDEDLLERSKSADVQSDIQSDLSSYYLAQDPSIKVGIEHLRRYSWDIRPHATWITWLDPGITRDHVCVTFGTDQHMAPESLRIYISENDIPRSPRNYDIRHFFQLNPSVSSLQDFCDRLARFLLLTTQKEKGSKIKALHTTTNS